MKLHMIIIYSIIFIILVITIDIFSSDVIEYRAKLIEKTFIKGHTTVNNDTYYTSDGDMVFGSGTSYSPDEYTCIVLVDGDYLRCSMTLNQYYKLQIDHPCDVVDVCGGITNYVYFRKIK